MILAGDVGGTKVHLALYDFTNGKLKYTREERFPAKDYTGLEAIVKEFLGADQATAAQFTGDCWGRRFLTSQSGGVRPARNSRDMRPL